MENIGQKIKAKGKKAWMDKSGKKCKLTAYLMCDAVKEKLRTLDLISADLI